MAVVIYRRVMKKTVPLVGHWTMEVLWVTMLGIALEISWMKAKPWLKMNPMTLVYMTYTAMCGSGATMATKAPIPTERPPTTQISPTRPQGYFEVVTGNPPQLK
jgi:hypothetical protein